MGVEGEQNLNIRFPRERAEDSLQDKGHIRSQQWLLEKVYRENAYLTRMKLNFKLWEVSSHYGDQKYKWIEDWLDILRKNVHELLNYKGTICSSANSYAADYCKFKRKPRGNISFYSSHLFFFPRHLLQDTEKER